MWDTAAKRSRVQVVYNFGREEPATREALERLVASVLRLLEEAITTLPSALRRKLPGS